VGEQAARAVRDYTAFATHLAFLRAAAERGAPEPDFAAREAELLSHLWHRRALAQPALAHAVALDEPPARRMPPPLPYGPQAAYGYPAAYGAQYGAPYTPPYVPPPRAAWEPPQPHVPPPYGAPPPYGPPPSYGPPPHPPKHL
jgi:hypothetical protein